MIQSKNIANLYVFLSLIYNTQISYIKWYKYNSLKILMLHTFSPNWYRPQCLHITKTHLYYASNYLLYEYSLEQRKVSKQLCLRQIAISMKINFKDIKIVSIVQYQVGYGMDIESMGEKKSESQFIYVAINQSYVFLIEILPLQFKIVQTFQLQNRIPDYLYPASPQAFVFSDIEGNLYLYNYSDKKVNQIKTPGIIPQKDKVKQIKYIDSYFLVFYLRGNILVFDKTFNKILKTVNIGYQQSILCVDFIYCSKFERNFIAILTKQKEQYFLTVFAFEFHQEFPLEYKKKINQIAEQLYRLKIIIVYPKKIMEKNKQTIKAALCIKLISGKKCIISGKFGQIYTLFMQKIAKQNKKQLFLKPYSHNQDAIQYQVWPSSSHYKDIFCMKAGPNNNFLYFLGTDHILSVWNTQVDQNLEETIKSIYSIKFLTTGVSSIFFSQADPMTIFLLLRDSIIRSFSPLEEGSHHLNQYWKHTKKYQVNRVASHLKQPGVLALLTSQHTILLYDIYEDRMIKTIQCPSNEQPVNISFQNYQVQQALSVLYCQETEQLKQVISIADSNSGYKINTLFARDLDKEVVLKIQFKSKIVLIKDLAEKNIKTVTCFLKDKKLQRLDRFKYWNGDILVSSQQKNNILFLDIAFKGVFFCLHKQLPINSARVIFRYVKSEQKLLVVFYKSFRMHIQEYLISENPKKIVSIRQKCVNLQISIDHIILDHESYAAAMYNQRQNVLQILNINDENPIPTLYAYPTKIECISFYTDGYIVVGSKDQAIKVLKYAQLLEFENKKKNKVISIQEAPKQASQIDNFVQKPHKQLEIMQIEHIGQEMQQV